MRTLLFTTSLLVAACSGPAAEVDSGAPPRDAGGMDASSSIDGGPLDSGARDASAFDASPADDAGDSGDAGAHDAGPDAGTLAEDGGGVADAGRDASAEPDGSVDACGGFGDSCTSSADCASPYNCDPLHRICVPVGRPSCGGFAGAPCPASGDTECRYLDGADYGVCLTPAEDACACPSRVFQCP